jgi:hypothetical protein
MDQLQRHLEQAGKQVGTVRTSKYEYEQTLTYDPEEPWNIRIALTRTELKKDRSQTATYALNLADVNPRLIQYRDERKELVVVLRTTGDQDLIRATDEDGEADFESSLFIRVADVDQAQALRDHLREAVEPAREAWAGHFSPATTLTELQDYLEETVLPVEMEDDRFDHRWERDQDRDDVVHYTVTDDETVEITAYRFSLADISTNAVRLEAARGKLEVEMETVASQDLILESEGDVAEGYGDRLRLPVGSIEAGRRFIRSVQAAIPLAKAYQEALLPTTGVLDADLAALGELLEQEGSDPDVRSSLQPGPVSRLTVTRTNSKGETEEDEYIFDFGDLSAKSVELTTRGATVWLEVKTRDGNDYIQHLEDGEGNGFTDELQFILASVEDGKIAHHLLLAIIEQAAAREVQAGDFDWLGQRLAQIAEGPDQKLGHQEDGESCSWQFIRTEEGKQVEEDLYDFNLYNLDPKRIEIETKGTAVYLLIPTLKREKIINLYENDEPSFVEEMKWQLSTLEDARRARATLAAEIGKCQ